MMDTEAGADLLQTSLRDLVGDVDVVDFLHRLTERAAGIGTSAAVGAMLADEQGRLRFMAASDDDGVLLELIQLGLEDGPCPEAFRTNQEVASTDLGPGRADRWPRFSAAATQAGFDSVRALPLQLDGESIGAMGWFSRESGEVADGDHAWMRAVADLATLAVLQERPDLRSTTALVQVQSALNSRVVIEQARGAVAQADGVDVREAFDVLRAHARDTGRRLVDVAADVVSRPRHASAWWRDDAPDRRG